MASVEASPGIVDYHSLYSIMIGYKGPFDRMIDEMSGP